MSRANTIKNFLFLAILPLFSVSVFGQACYDFESCVGKPLKSQCTEQFGNGCIDWDKGIIYSVGIGVPNMKFESVAQKNRSAAVAAKVIAQRNLLELIEGIKIDSSTTIKSGVATNDTIRSRVTGKLRRSQTLGQPKFLNDGSVAVTVRLFMKDFTSLFLQGYPYAVRGNSASLSSTPSDPVPENSEESGPYTGLIVDARGLGVVPSLAPKIITKNQEEVYGSAYVERSFAVEQGMAGYVKTTEQAKSNDRVSGNPLVMKAVASSGSNGADMIISDQDGEKLKTLYASHSFLREARVVVLVD